MAVKGTRYVLNACLKHKITKVVVTSSVAAMIDNQLEHDENSWFTPHKDHPYSTSKSLAE